MSSFHWISNINTKKNPKTLSMLASRCSSSILLQICTENIWKRKKKSEFFCVCIQPYPISILESNFKKNRMNPFIQTFTYKIHYKSMSSTSSHTKWTKIFRQNVRLSGKCATTVSTFHLSVCVYVLCAVHGDEKNIGPSNFRMVVRDQLNEVQQKHIHAQMRICIGQLHVVIEFFT